jgi:dipeptidyl-peptidase-4
MFKPTHFDARRSIPSSTRLSRPADRLLRQPQLCACSHRDAQSLAELGFIVVCIDGMGTNLRSKSFHEAYFANLGDNTIPDQVTGMKQLAAKYPFIDLDRAGMYGHSGGGNATAAAMFTTPTSSR